MPENPFYAFDLEYANGGSPPGTNYTNGNISRMCWWDKNIGSYTEGISFTEAIGNDLSIKQVKRYGVGTVRK